MPFGLRAHLRDVAGGEVENIVLPGRDREDVAGGVIGVDLDAPALIVDVASGRVIVGVGDGLVVFVANSFGIDGTGVLFICASSEAFDFGYTKS